MGRGKLLTNHLGVERVGSKLTEFAAFTVIMQLEETVFTEEAWRLWSQLILASHPGRVQDAAHTALVALAPVLEHQPGVVRTTRAVSAVHQSVWGVGPTQLAPPTFLTDLRSLAMSRCSQLPW